MIQKIRKWADPIKLCRNNKNVYNIQLRQLKKYYLKYTNINVWV